LTNYDCIFSAVFLIISVFLNILSLISSLICFVASTKLVAWVVSRSFRV